MACSVRSNVSSNPRVFPSKSLAPMASLSPAPGPLSKALAAPKSFRGLRKDFQPRSSPMVSASRSSRRSFVVNSVSGCEPPLVGNPAPDFEAEAVFDQEFIKFSHLAWVQTDRKSGGLGDLKYPLISDVTKSISKSYGLLIPDQSLQYVQENPDEVCPAGWKPGEKSMKPGPKLGKEYFAAV